MLNPTTDTLLKSSLVIYIPRSCVTYLLLEPSIPTRYAGFQQSLLKCNKFPVRFLARLVQHDLRTVSGRNLRQIALECGKGLPVKQFPSKTIVKETMKYYTVPNSDAWRVGLLHDHLDVRNKMSTLTGFYTAEVQDMIKFICTS